MIIGQDVGIRQYEIYSIEVIEYIEEKIEKAWRMFILSNFDVGMNTLIEIFNDIDLLLKNIVNIRFEKKTKIDVQELFEQLTILENSMQTQDYIMISDLIKYEIEPIIVRWKNEINKEIRIKLN